MFAIHRFRVTPRSRHREIAKARRPCRQDLSDECAHSSRQPPLSRRGVWFLLQPSLATNRYHIRVQRESLAEYSSPHISSLRQRSTSLRLHPSSNISSLR